MIESKRPLYIAIEGIEGCGKTTQASRLANAMGAGTVLTRENGGTRIGQNIRMITHSPSFHPMDPWCEALLFAADRAQHITEVVDPALLAGRSVISDRSYVSSLAYQGYGRELGVDPLLQVNEYALHSRWPDLVIHLKIDYETLMERMKGQQLDRMEREGKDFFGRVIKGFDEMRNLAPCDRWAVLDGMRPIDEVTANIIEVVETYIKDWA